MIQNQAVISTVTVCIATLVQSRSIEIFVSLLAMQMNNIYPIKSIYPGIFLTILVSISIVGTLQSLNGLESSIKLVAINVGHGWNDFNCYNLSENTTSSVLLETVCLMNPANETYMTSAAVKNEFASNIFEAMQATV